MTLAEFDAMQFTADITVIYHFDNKEHSIVACDFNERLVALEGVIPGSNAPHWVRCENVTIVGALTPA